MTTVLECLISERHHCTKEYCTGHFTYITFLRYVVFVDDVEPTVFYVGAHTVLPSHWLRNEESCIC